MGFHGNTVMTIMTFKTPMSHNCHGSMVTTNTNCWLWKLWENFINSLWPSDAIGWHTTGSTLIQVMACCLMAPSHYLNQCWFIISQVLCHSSQSLIKKCQQNHNATGFHTCQDISHHSIHVLKFTRCQPTEVIYHNMISLVQNQIW